MRKVISFSASKPSGLEDQSTSTRDFVPDKTSLENAIRSAVYESRLDRSVAPASPAKPFRTKVKLNPANSRGAALVLLSVKSMYWFESNEFGSCDGRAPANKGAVSNPPPLVVSYSKMPNVADAPLAKVLTSTSDARVPPMLIGPLTTGWDAVEKSVLKSNWAWADVSAGISRPAARAIEAAQLGRRIKKSWRGLLEFIGGMFEGSKRLAEKFLQ